MKVFSILLCIFCWLNPEKPAYKITYNLTFKPTNKSGQNINDELLASVNNVKRLYVLESNGTNSVYRFDTIIYEGNKSFSHSNLMDIAFYKDFKKGEILIYDKLPKKRSGTIMSIMKPGDWQIFEETKMIGNYKTKKALLKRPGKQITAWFTNQVAIQDGPEMYAGLPGLIVKLDMEDISLELNRIERITANRIPPYPKVDYMLSASDFENYKKNKMTGHMK